jgi:hypothetical protein
MRDDWSVAIEPGPAAEAELNAMADAIATLTAERDQARAEVRRLRGVLAQVRDARDYLSEVVDATAGAAPAAHR